MNDNMNDNRGFTLVELLAVIVILGSISLVTVMGITASLERRDERECEEQIELAKNAAKIYFSLQDGGPINGNSVTIDTLISAEYIDSDSKVDRLSAGSITLSGGSYTYSGTCN